MPAELISETDCNTSQVSGNKIKIYMKESKRFVNALSLLLTSLWKDAAILYDSDFL
jgi:hypothetical protein